MYWLIFSLITLLVFCLAVGAVFGFRRWPEPHGRRRRLAENITLSVFAVLVVLLLLEVFFKLFFAQSDTFGHTLAARNWLEQYWQVNSLGYRDIEWTPELVQGRTKIMVLGDSFVAGHGIKNPADRFSDLLGQMLGPGYAVMNVGSNGANTRNLIKDGLAYPFPPDIVILSFYLNDIEETAASLGVRRPVSAAGQPGGLIDHSYALNFFYWRVNRLAYQAESKQYWDWLLGLYDDPEIWPVYEQELLEIAGFLHARNRQLIVVVFPALRAIEESRGVTSRVANLYAGQGVPVVDVTGLVEGIDPDSLVVNAVDAHPNERVHRLVAEKLYQLIVDNRPLSTVVK